MSRRVITATTINELLAQGTTCLQLEPGDIVTALAAEDAQRKGLRVIPAKAAARAQPTGAAPSDADNEHAEVRKAVIAALGHTPEGLDQIISKVMK